MKISILCITYNHEKTIIDCLKGFEMQNQDLVAEILIFDDSSTDSTVSKIMEFDSVISSKIKLHINKSNVGARENLILGLKKCSADYIAICEGDDYWCDEDKLESQYILMDKNNYAGVYHLAYVKNEEGKITKTIPYKGKTFRNLGEFFVTPYQIPTSAMFFRRKTFLKYQSLFSALTRKSTIIMDFYLDYIISKEGTYFFLDKKMSVYRLSKGTSSFNSMEVEKVKNEMLGTRDSLIDIEPNFKKELEISKGYVVMSVAFKFLKRMEFLNLLKFLFSLKVRELYVLLKSVVRFTRIKILNG